MITCTICRFTTELDDVAIPATGGRCVCLHCYARETGSGVRMPPDLWRSIAAVLAMDSVA
jgi:hypothetical protein